MVLFYDISQMLQILTQVMVLYVIETEHVFEVTPVLRKWKVIEMYTVSRIFTFLSKSYSSNTATNNNKYDTWPYKGR